MTKFDQDKIGRKEIVDKICVLVDSLTKDEHFCFALDGEWGSGKSFVLDMIAEKLQEHVEYTVIKYDAWENSFYSDPLIAILRCVIDGIQDKLSQIKGFEEAFKQFGKDVWNNFVQEFPHVKILTGVIKSISNFIKKLNKPFSKDTTKSAIGEFKSYQDLLKEVKKCLAKITTEPEWEGKQSKLIILVDELDRCLPDEQLKILERLHHLFDVPNSAVIVTINKESIAKNVSTVFGVDGIEYLRKFFDFNFKINVSADEYLRSLLIDFANTLNKVAVYYKPWDNCLDIVYLCLKHGTKNVLSEIDNREITRFYDSLRRACNDFGYENLQSYYVFFLILGLFIRRYRLPSFLSEENVKANQYTLDSVHLQGNIPHYKQDEMPYFDYLKVNIGLCSGNIPEALLSKYAASDIVSFLWAFNETVFYSYGKQFWYNEYRSFYNQPKVNSEDCQRLRKLVMLYGGGVQ